MGTLAAGGGEEAFRRLLAGADPAGPFLEWLVARLADEHTMLLLDALDEVRAEEHHAALRRALPDFSAGRPGAASC